MRGERGPPFRGADLPVRGVADDVPLDEAGLAVDTTLDDSRTVVSDPDAHLRGGRLRAGKRAGAEQKGETYFYNVTHVFLFSDRSADNGQPWTFPVTGSAAGLRTPFG